MMAWVTNLLLHPCVLVGLGGAVGCNIRYGLSLWQKRFVFSAEFPVATTLANLLGSLLIGFLAARFQERGSTGYLLLAVGFCGGLTTFSSLALELLEHSHKQRWDRFAVEVGLNFLLGLLLCYAGWKLAHR